jgi:hypothetical protein
LRDDVGIRMAPTVTPGRGTLFATGLAPRDLGVRSCPMIANRIDTKHL